MKPLLVLCLVLVSRLSAAPPENYYQTAKDLAGEELRKALHDIIDDHTVLRYCLLYTSDAADE